VNIYINILNDSDSRYCRSGENKDKYCLNVVSIVVILAPVLEKGEGKSCGLV
jgi:hypothetical protein